MPKLHIGQALAFLRGGMMRHYYGGDSPYNIRFGPPLTKTVKSLILINVGVFVLQIILKASNLETQFSLLFGLVPILVLKKLMLWQFFTYMFLHGGVFHIFWNMFLLWMFGSDLEREWGRTEFIRYYFITGIGAGILYYLSAVHSDIPTIGASGAILGVLVAFAMTFPDRMITLLVFFIFPVTMKAKHLVLILGAFELLTYLSYGNAEGIARFAHLGGMLVGYLYLKWWKRRYSMDSWRPGPGTELKEKLAGLSARQEEELEKDVDLILDKISKEGIRSLTRMEKKILQKKAKK